MAASSRIRLLRRVSGAAGAPAALLSGEIAYNMADGIFYAGKGDDGAGNATSVVAFAKDGYADPSTLYQPLDGDLTALAALDATTGLLVRSAANTFIRRTLAAAASTRVAITNGDGVAGNPTIDLGQPVIGGSGAAANITKVTVDLYGRVTNTSQMSLTDASAPTAAFDFNAQRLTGLADPTSAQDAATKNYVDNAVLGLDPKPSVRAATTAALPAVTATNTTLTANANGALAAQDGVTLAAGERLLVKNQAAAAQNGIYIVTQVGSGATPFILTRAADMDSWAEVPGAHTFVEEGTANADKGFLSTADTGGALGATAITWSAFGAGGGGFTIAGAGLVSADGITVDVGAGTGIAVAADSIGLTDQALALHNVVTAADQLIYATGVSTFAATAFTAFGRSLVDDADAATARTTLGLGTMATQAANNVAITGGTIGGAVIDGGTF
jgi:hypothetical protein